MLSSPNPLAASENSKSEIEVRFISINVSDRQDATATDANAIKRNLFIMFEFNPAKITQKYLHAK